MRDTRIWQINTEHEMKPLIEPWKLTLSEVQRDVQKGKRMVRGTEHIPGILAERGGHLRAGWRNVVRKAHYNEVLKALNAGKPVPPNVMRDYPDLERKYGHPSNARGNPGDGSLSEVKALLYRYEYEGDLTIGDLVDGLDDIRPEDHRLLDAVENYREAELANKRTSGRMTMDRAEDDLMRVLQEVAGGMKSNPGKEPWQMTFKKFASLERDKFDEWWYHGKGSEHRPPGGPDIVSFGEDVKSDHAISVKNAIADGLPVPPEVLSDYPELAGKDRGGKEPWEMTRSEWLRQPGVQEAMENERRKTSKGLVESGKVTADFMRTHRLKVERAFAEGKPVPERVLSEYRLGEPSMNRNPKEPWEMIPYEFRREMASHPERYAKYTEGIDPRGMAVLQGGWSMDIHRKIVAEAIGRGWKIPREVMQSYPELGSGKQGLSNSRKFLKTRIHDWKRRTGMPISNPGPRTYYLGYYYDGNQLVGQLSDDLDGMSPTIVIDPPLIDFEASSDREALLRARAELREGADLESNLSKYRYIPISSKAARANPRKGYRKHRLIIDSLHDATAHCTAGDWNFSGTGARSATEIRDVFERHLETEREIMHGFGKHRRSVGRNPSARRDIAQKMGDRILADEYLELMDINEEAVTEADIPGLLESNIAFLVKREFGAGSKPSVVVHDWELLGKEESRTVDTILGTYSVTFSDESAYDGNFVADGTSYEGGFVLNGLYAGSRKLKYFG